eukprot:2587649-Rhodomonas_salina.3
MDRICRLLLHVEHFLQLISGAAEGCVSAGHPSYHLGTSVTDVPDTSLRYVTTGHRVARA